MIGPYVIGSFCVVSFSDGTLCRGTKKPYEIDEISSILYG